MFDLFCWWRMVESRCWSHGLRWHPGVYAGSLWCATAVYHHSWSVPLMWSATQAQWSLHLSLPEGVLVIAPYGPLCRSVLAPTGAVFPMFPSSTHHQQFNTSTPTVLSVCIPLMHGHKLAFIILFITQAVECQRQRSTGHHHHRPLRLAQMFYHVYMYVSFFSYVSYYWFDCHWWPAKTGICSGSLPFYAVYVWCCHWLTWQINFSLSLSLSLSLSTKDMASVTSQCKLSCQYQDSPHLHISHHHGLCLHFQSHTVSPRSFTLYKLKINLFQKSFLHSLRVPSQLPGFGDDLLLIWFFFVLVSFLKFLFSGYLW